MGKVFTPEEIQAEAIPVEGAHLAAADIIIDQLFYGEAFDQFKNYPNEYIGFTGINAGLIHGSVTHGTENVRSDLDVLLIHMADVERFDTLGVVRDVFGRITSNLHVPVEANIIELTDAHDRRHRIDPLFLRYLEHAQGDERFSVNFPVNDLGIGFMNHRETPQSLLRVVQRYTGAKTTSFAGALTQETPTDEHRYQRALELPKNLGRKVISMTNLDFLPAEASGDEIVEGFRSFVSLCSSPEWLRDPRNSFRSDLHRLDALDREYTEVLKSTIDGETTIEAYHDWLEGNRLDALKLAHRICVATQGILRAYGKSLPPPNPEVKWVPAYGNAEPEPEFGPSDDEPDADDYLSYMTNHGEFDEFDSDY